jgi:hypothetical protein
MVPGRGPRRPFGLAGSWNRSELRSLERDGLAEVARLARLGDLGLEVRSGLATAGALRRVRRRVARAGRCGGNAASSRSAEPSEFLGVAALQPRGLLGGEALRLRHLDAPAGGALVVGRAFQLGEPLVEQLDLGLAAAAGVPAPIASASFCSGERAASCCSSFLRSARSVARAFSPAGPSGGSAGGVGRRRGGGVGSVGAGAGSPGGGVGTGAGWVIATLSVVTGVAPVRCSGIRAA